MTAKLPYKMLGGVMPCPGGWCIVPARFSICQLCAAPLLITFRTCFISSPAA